MSYLIDLDNWYIAAGAIPTIVWNNLTSNESEKFLNDIDIVYYDNDISEAAENANSNKVKEIFTQINHKIDVKNQARVHTWYRDKAGKQISQYQSTEDGIKMWLSVTAIGVRTINGENEIYAPYGLGDLFSMQVRPNHRIISEHYYQNKVRRWQKQWPEVKAFGYYEL